MDTQKTFPLEDILHVCATLNGITRRGHKNLQLGLPAIANVDEQTRIVHALELLHCSVVELCLLIQETDDRAQRAFLCAWCNRQFLRPA
ncbi:hypothetical protein ACYZTX_00550 [Pseudomonas sp. MDT1-17]